MSRAKLILELVDDEFDPEDRNAFHQAQRDYIRHPISGTSLLKPRYQLPPEEVEQAVQELPEPKQMELFSQVAQNIADEDPKTMKEISRIPPQTKKRVFKAIAAGSFWLAAIYAMPWLGIPLFGIRLFQRFKARSGPSWKDRMKTTPPKWV